MQDGSRMWVKGDGRSHRSRRPCPFDHRLHDPLMTEVQSVKDPECQNGRAEDVSVLGAVKYLHNPKENSILAESVMANA